jgi:hypothetical protein
MIARCARCQQTFSTDRFGVQSCPLCGAEIHLADPSAPAPPPPPAPPSGAGGWGAPPPPPAGFGAPPPAGGWGPPQGPPQQPPPGAWGPIPPGGVQPPPPGEGESAPFARRAQLGWPQAWSQTIKLVAFEPTRFFRLVKVSESGSAVLFGVIGATIGTWVSLIFSYFTAAASFSFLEQIAGQMQEKGVNPEAFSWFFKRVTGGAIALQALATPLLALVAIYVAAAVFHLVLLLLRGAPRGFDATLTVVGYAYGIYLLGALPMCGGLVAVVWFAVAAIAGLTEAHRGRTWKSALAVSSPLLLLCLCGCLAAVTLPNLMKLPGRSGTTSL